MVIGQQREIANRVLRSLELLDPACILAGGAPRDWYFGLPAKDLDFYYHVSPHICFEESKAQLAQVLGKEVNALGQGGGHHLYAGMPNLRTVFECEMDGLKCQFMLMNAPTYTGVVDDFAVSLSKVWYKRNVCRTQEFDETVETGIVRLNKGYDYDHKYVKKIMKKYPNYEYLMEGVNE